MLSILCTHLEEKRTKYRNYLFIYYDKRIERHPFQCQLWVKCYRVKIFRTCLWDRRGRDRIVIGFITTYAISTYHH